MKFSSIKKIAKDKYVFIYSANERLCALSYCYSNSPEGPWTYGGKIIDNGKYWPFGNNHGSIFQAAGKWYVVYHKKTNNDFNRQAMIEPIQVFVDGDKVVIPEVEMTSQGVLAEGLNAFSRYNINTACYLTNNAYIDGSQRNSDGLNPLCGISQNNTIVGFKYLNFGKEKITDKDKLKLWLNVMMISPDAEVAIQIVLKSTVDSISQRVNLARFKLRDFIKADGFYHNISLSIKGIDINNSLNKIGGLKGEMAFFLLFNDNGKEVCRLKEFEFAKGDTPIQTPLLSIKINNEIANGTVSALPSKGRAGESVKLVIMPKKGNKLGNLLVKDEKGHVVKLNPNAKTPYAPESFNFEMPKYPVTVSFKFIPCNN